MTLLEAPSALDRMALMPPAERRQFVLAMSERERLKLDRMLAERVSNPYFAWRNDPVGFVTDRAALGETAWSLQRRIMVSVRDNPRTAVPACHAPGKSHIAARIIAWWGSVHPEGTARILTTATTFRQVRNVLWPYLRRVHSMHGLPGRMNMVEWRIGPSSEILAEGVKPPDNDETALSGLHAPHVLIVVDEAGGISHAFGQTLLGLQTGSHTRTLLIGNPPADDEGSWFEEQCALTDLYNVIPIPAELTPNWTGEDAGRCMAHPEMEPHPVRDHLVDKQWAEDLVRQFGEGSAVVLARRDAIFPKNNESKVLPAMWLAAAARDRDENGIALEDDRMRPGPIRLGVDIAAGGEDEFVIGKLDGNVLSIAHRKRGAELTVPGYVAEQIRIQARAAVATHLEREIPDPVRVKIDVVGVGWGIYQGLEADQGDPEKRIEGVVYVPVEAGKAGIDSAHFHRQRDEGWWTLRTQVRDPETGVTQVVLDFGEAEKEVLGQLNAPKYTSDSAGKLVVESKDAMKDRGISSPDLADGVWMAVYEPRRVAVIPAAAPIDVSATRGERVYSLGMGVSFG